MVRKDEFVKTHPEVRMGMEAYSHKGERLGIIERLDDDSIIIEKGHIFHHGVSLPYDAIEDIREDQVIIRQGEERMEEEEELKRQYERDRSAREEQFQGEREEMLERESERGGLRPEETGMGEGFEEGGWEESTRREAGLEEADISRRARAGSGWEERESTRGEEEIRIPVREEEVEVTKKPVAKEEVRAREEKRTETEPVSGEVRKEEAKAKPGETMRKK